MENNSNTEVVITSNDVYTLINIGKYDQALDILMNNPDAFASLIKALDDNIVDSKKQAEEIRDRNWFKKLFANNSKDLADVMFEQNQTLAALFVICQLQSLSSAGSAKILGQLLEYSKEEANTTGKENSNLQKVAIRMLEYNTKEIKKDEIRDKALMKCLTVAERLQETIDNVNSNLALANQNYEENIKSLQVKFDSYKNELAESISVFQSNFQELSEAQTKSAASLENKLIEQSEQHKENLTNNFNSYISEMKSSQNTFVENVMSSFKSLKTLSIVFCSVALAISIVSLIISLR